MNVTREGNCGTSCQVISGLIMELSTGSPFATSVCEAWKFSVGAPKGVRGLACNVGLFLGVVAAVGVGVDVDVSSTAIPHGSGSAAIRV